MPGFQQPRIFPVGGVAWREELGGLPKVCARGSCFICREKENEEKAA
jgi:hypothetical protein